MGRDEEEGGRAKDTEGRREGVPGPWDSGSEWSRFEVNSRALALLGGGMGGKRRDGASERSRMLLSIGVVARGGKWEGREGSAEGLGVIGPE
jgi:hypothetical protein